MELEYPNLPPADAVCMTKGHGDRPAEYERVTGMGVEPGLADMLGDGGAFYNTEWVCEDCAD